MKNGHAKVKLISFWNIGADLGPNWINSEQGILSSLDGHAQKNNLRSQDYNFWSVKPFKLTRYSSEWPLNACW